MKNKFPEIVINDLSVGYKIRDKINVLIKGFTTQISAGEIVALMGSNGCGKSTLLRSVTGFQNPLSGEVKIDGKDIRSISMKQRASYISYVSTEQIRIGNMTVSDLVGLGRYLYSGWWGNLSEEDVFMVRRCLELTGLSNLSDRRLNCLSDGERQRAMIARALAQDTPVLILDEPTAFLDVSNKYEIINLLRELAVKEHKAVIFSSHDFSITMNTVDKVWLVADKKVMEGAPEDLALTGSYAALFNGSSMTFIPETGEIIMKERPEKTINIVAGGVVREWLTKAFVRKGYVNNNKAHLKVTANLCDNGYVFDLEYSGNICRFDSIYKLLVEIKALEQKGFLLSKINPD